MNLSKKQSNEDLGLQMENLSRKIDDLKSTLPKVKEISQETEKVTKTVTDKITKFALSIRASKLIPDELEGYFGHPYVIYKTHEDYLKEFKHDQFQRHLAIPKFSDIQLGWLEEVTESHNIFLINPFVDMLNEIPDVLRKEMDLPDPLNVVLDGEYLVGKDTDKIREEFSGFITHVEKDGRLKIDKSRHFDLLVKLLKKNIRPFPMRGVKKEDIIERKCDFTLRDYQKQIWQEFLKYSFVGIFIPPSTGKTFEGMYGCTHLKPPHLISVPSTTLIEQWLERFELYTDLKARTWTNASERKKVLADLDKNEVDVLVLTYQSAIRYCHDRRWKLKIVDEVHHMPANLFSKLITIPSDYGMGLSGSPQREDGREDYVFAFSGKAIGLNWDIFRKMKLIQNPECHVWIVKNENERLNKLSFILGQEHQRTLIFCDRIEYGKKLSEIHNLPFVYSVTKNKLEEITKNKTCIVSRIADEGLSLPDISRVIEVSWLFGSRRQELQRMTRLLHGKGMKKEHHIIMTGAEYQADHKRLFGLYDKGFKIMIHREGVSEKVVQLKEFSIKKISQPKQPAKDPGQLSEEKKKMIDFEMKHPILSLPGIQKKLATLNKGERILVGFLYQKEKVEFKGEALAMLLGYKDWEAMRHSIDFTKLVNIKLISKTKGGTFMADSDLLGINGK